MIRMALLASAIAFSPIALHAQTTSTGTMTEADVGVSPTTGVSAGNYVQFAGDADKYEIESSKVAEQRATRPDVKAYASQLVSDHTASSKALTASLKNGQRTLNPPASKLSNEKQALVDQLKKAPKTQFDNLYLTQQIDAHKKAWALQKGYATTGEDPALKQLAANNVPVIEGHLTQAKALLPAGVSAR